jgi:hypothetical protein
MAKRRAAILNQKSDFNPYLAYNKKKVEDHANISKLTKIPHLYSIKKFIIPFSSLKLTILKRTNKKPREVNQPFLLGFKYFFTF